MAALDSFEKERAVREVTAELNRLHHDAREGLSRTLRKIVAGGLMVAALFALCSALSGLRLNGAREELGSGVPVVIFILGSALIFAWHLGRAKRQG